MAWASEQESTEHFRTVTAPDCWNCGANPCYFLCFRSPMYVGPEQEREEAMWQESLSQGEYMSLAMAEYKRAHGEPYVS